MGRFLTVKVSRRKWQEPTLNDICSWTGQRQPGIAL